MHVNAGGIKKHGFRSARRNTLDHPGAHKVAVFVSKQVFQQYFSANWHPFDAAQSVGFRTFKRIDRPILSR